MYDVPRDPTCLPGAPGCVETVFPRIIISSADGMGVCPAPSMGEAAAQLLSDPKSGQSTYSPRPPPFKVPTVPSTPCLFCLDCFVR